MVGGGSRARGSQNWYEGRPGVWHLPAGAPGHATVCVCSSGGQGSPRVGRVGTGHVIHAPSAQWSTTQPFRQGDWGPLRETWKSVKIHRWQKK